MTVKDKFYKVIDDKLYIQSSFKEFKIEENWVKDIEADIPIISKDWIIEHDLISLTTDGKVKLLLKKITEKIDDIQEEIQDLDAFRLFVLSDSDNLPPMVMDYKTYIQPEIKTSSIPTIIFADVDDLPKLKKQFNHSYSLTNVYVINYETYQTVSMILPELGEINKNTTTNEKKNHQLINHFSVAFNKAIELLRRPNHPNFYYVVDTTKSTYIEKRFYFQQLDQTSSTIRLHELNINQNSDQHDVYDTLNKFQKLSEQWIPFVGFANHNQIPFNVAEIVMSINNQPFVQYGIGKTPIESYRNAYKKGLASFFTNYFASNKGPTTWALISEEEDIVNELIFLLFHVMEQKNNQQLAYFEFNVTDVVSLIDWSFFDRINQYEHFHEKMKKYTLTVLKAKGENFYKLHLIDEKGFLIWMQTGFNLNEKIIEALRFMFAVHIQNKFDVNKETIYFPKPKLQQMSSTEVLQLLDEKEKVSITQMKKRLSEYNVQVLLKEWHYNFLLTGSGMKLFKFQLEGELT